ncbi:MAG: hypothetical protein FJY98_03030 [Candidatus Liptonbacteria bacterium]|nr:hypothetical protein [Candidatus Liptonbacteria bacterium]
MKDTLDPSLFTSTVETLLSLTRDFVSRTNGVRCPRVTIYLTLIHVMGEQMTAGGAVFFNGIRLQASNFLWDIIFPKIKQAARTPEEANLLRAMILRCFTEELIEIYREELLRSISPTSSPSDSLIIKA